MLRTSYSWDRQRTLNTSLSFGLASGLLCHFWYAFLDRAVPGGGLRVVGRKILLDQAVFSPLNLVACVAASSALDNGGSVSSEVSRTLPSLYLADCLLWPPAQCVNFYFLPTPYRVLFDNGVTCLFNVYASKVKHGHGNDFPGDGWCANA